MFKLIKQDFLAAIQWLREYLFHKRHSIRLALAVRMANMKQKGWNKQYFVILSPDDRLIAVNNDDVERLKRRSRYSKSQLRKIENILRERAKEAEEQMKTDKVEPVTIRQNLYDMKLIRERSILRMKRMKLLPKNLDGIKLRKTCFYFTPLSNNNDPGMSKEDRREAKVRYITYAKKYLK